jgi:regulator of sigma E protease
MSSLLAGLLLLGVLVVVHEFGHFIVAKWFGVGVPTFSVGMGPRLWGFHWRGTDYRLSALPIGGYVRMSGADPFGEEEEGSEPVPPEVDFTRKPVWQRLMIMAAGPAFNLVLPLILFTAVLMFGEPQPDTTVGQVIPGSVAEQAGFDEGDRIVAIDGTPIDGWGGVVKALESAGPAAIIEVERDGTRRELRFPIGSVPKNAIGGWEAASFGLAWRPQSSRIGVDDPASPAGRAGLRTGDLIRSVDDRAVRTWEELRVALAGATHRVAYARAGASGVTEHVATLNVDPSWQRPDDGSTDAFGLVPSTLFVGSVEAGSPAEAAGFLADDRLWSIDGQVVTSWEQMRTRVAASVERPAPGVSPRSVQVVVLRGGAPVSFPVVPRLQQETVGAEVFWRPVMGVAPLLAKVITGEVERGKAVGGPVKMVMLAGEAAEMGIFSYVRLIGAISISLGVVNLLPVPVLDGGHILFYALEAIRGRPLSIRVREKLQMAGVLVLVLLMLAVTVSDIRQWLMGG